MNKNIMQKGEEIYITEGRLKNVRGEYVSYDPLNNSVFIKVGTITHEVEADYVELVNAERLFMIYTMDNDNKIVYNRLAISSIKDIDSLCIKDENYLLINEIGDYNVILRKK